MKDALFYYYRINPLKIIKNKNNYYFEFNNYIYFLWVVDKPFDYVKEIVALNKNLFGDRFGRIIFNYSGESISLINNRYYILTMYNKADLLFDDIIFNPYYCNNDILKFKVLDHSDWGRLWCNKIDYFEYQKDFIKVKYPLLYKSLDYFVGLSENAIAYFNSINFYLKKEFNDTLAICRRKFNSSDYSLYNPLNIVIDHKSRDLALYLQDLFVKDDFDYDEIGRLINNLDYSNYQFSLLMARLLYPGFYFDIYEEIINGFLNEREIVYILKRTNEYEIFLKYVYEIINKKKSILKIDWLENFN